MKNQGLFTVLAIALILFAYNNAIAQYCQWDVYNSYNSGMQIDYVNDIVIDQNNHIWIATSGYGLIEFDNDTTWTLYDMTNTGGQLPSNYINHLAIDANNNLWAAHDLGVTRFDGTNWSNFNQQNSGLTGDWVNSFAPDKHGNIWMSCITTDELYKGVVFYDNNNTWLTFDTLNTPGLLSNNVFDIQIDIYENVWFAYESNQDTGITKFDGTNWITITHADTVPIIEPLSFFIDNSGNIWLSMYSDYGIIRKFDGVNWTTYDISSYGINYISCLADDKYGELWIGSDSGALNFDGDTTWQFYDYTNGLPSSSVYSIASDPNGYIWFGTDMGIARLNTNAQLEVYVNYNTTQLDASDVNLYLYSPDIQTPTGQDSLIAKLTSSMQFNFYFPVVPPGNYYLKAVLTDTSTLVNVFNSYYSVTAPTYKWEEATIFSIDQCDIQSLNLSMYINTNVISNGTGTISGNISYISYNKSVGEPVPGAEVYIEQEPNDQPVLNSETDSNGDYSFTDIPDGTLFKLSVQIPGLPQIETYDSLSFTTANTTYDDLNFYVDTSGILIHDVTNIKLYSSNNITFNLYPNPAKESFNVSYSLQKPGNVKITLMDIYGNKIDELPSTYQNEGEYNHFFNLNKNNNAGIYYLYFTFNNNTIVKKLVINK